MHRVVATIGIVLSGAAPVSAQGWEVEVHAGGVVSGNVSDGSRALPADGGAFQTFNGRTSRRVSSWYFGTGSDLLEDVNAQFGMPATVAPLDPVLQAPLATRGNGAAIGFRVGRAFASRFSAEFSFDYLATSLGVTPGARRGIETSDGAFVPALDVAFEPLPESSVQSTHSIEEPGGGAYLMTGAVNIALTRGGTVQPYVTAGAGVWSGPSEGPSATLSGSYELGAQNRVAFSERDEVELRFVGDDSVFVGVFGGGGRVYLTPRSGLRFDARLHLGRMTVETRLDASPGVDAISPPSAIASATDPALQFSTVPVDELPSSLSGPEVVDFATFSGKQTVVTTTITAGYFFTF